MNYSYVSGLLLAGQPFLSALFRRTLLAFGAAVGEVVRYTTTDEYYAARRICASLSLVKAIFAAFFAGNRRRSPCHWIKSLLLGFVQLLFAHLVLGVTLSVAAFDPGHLAFGNGFDAAATATTPCKGNQAGHYQAHDYNTNHNRLFPAVFHVEISKLPNNSMVIIL